MPQKIGKPYIYLRKDGRYEGRYRKYLSPDRKDFKQVSVYGSTYEEALEKVLREQACNSMPEEEEKPVLIRELMEPWLLDMKKVMKPSSYALYRNYAMKYLLGDIGDRNAVGFDESALIAVLESFRTGRGKKKALAQNTVYLLEEMIRAMFRYGAEKKLVPEISFGKIKYRTGNTKEAMPLSELEMQRLLSVLEQQERDIQVQIMLPLYAGVSLSELCGLKWEDINLKSGKIHVHRNLKRIQQGTELLEDSLHDGVSEPKQKAGNGKAATMMEEYELSEGECRDFIMPEKLNGLLKKIAEEQKPTQRMYVAARNTGNNIAGLPDGRTLQYRLKSVGVQSQIPGLTFRTLRDTFAVMCLQAGGDIYSVAYVLGITVAAACDRYEPWMVRKEEFLKAIGDR